MPASRRMGFVDVFNGMQGVRMNVIKIVQFFSGMRFIKFGIVGALGVVINVGLLHLLTVYFRFDYKIGSIFAIEFAIINNFLWNFFWTWNDRKTGTSNGLLVRFVRFHVSSGFTALIVNWGLLVLLTETIHLHYQISNLIGIAFGSGINFLLGNFWVFPKIAKNHEGDAE
jgi:dolichol-phosphate mannosyltransferase